MVGTRHRWVLESTSLPLSYFSYAMFYFCSNIFMMLKKVY